MLERLAGLHAFVGVLPDEPVDEVHRLCRHRLGVDDSLGLHVEDLLHGLLPAEVVEGRLAGEQLEGEHAEAPEVDAHVVLLALEYFWGCVVEGAAVGLPAFVAEGGPAEVA